jgi:hypothetical protein
MSNDPNGWTVQRVNLRDWLVAQNSDLGEIYTGVVDMLFGRHMPGSVYFVCHGVREIGNRLPDVVFRAETSSRLEYRNEMEPIATLWRRGGISEALTVGIGGGVDALRSPADYIGMPRNLVMLIGELVEAHLVVRETNSGRALRLFESFLSPKRLPADVIRRKARQWRSATEWFVDHVHVGVDGPLAVTHDELVTRFDAFESPLISLFAGFYETLDKIDAILDEANRRSS